MIARKGAQTAKLRGLCGVSAAALAAWAGPALAQDAGPATASEQQIAQDAAATGGTIVVTGSRLITSGMDSPVPVTAVRAEELQAMDPTSLVASVSQLPQFMGNQTPNNSAFFARGGTGNLNLRGLGINRTLTLLNGRRVPSSSVFGGVDINIFPKAMIRSIETTTGGASAAYGTDAVAGVVNFILDTDFTGLQADIQGGITDRGDGESYSGSLSAGFALGDRGHVLLSAEGAHQEGIHSYKGRNWYQSWGSVQGSDGVWNFYPDVHSMNASFDGVIFAPGTAINGLKFDRSGNVSPFVPGTITQGALGTPPARTVGGDGDDLGGELSEVQTLYPDVDRYSLFGYADYEVADGVKVFGQYIRGYNKLFQWNTPRGGFGGTPTALTIFSGNPYLPADVQQTMTDNGIASFTLRRMGSIEDIGQMRFNDETTQDIGTAGFTADIDTGGFMDGWRFDGYYQYGRSKRVWTQVGIRLDRIFAALDAVRDPDTGDIVCNVSLNPAGAAAFPGCQPLNLFGRGNASAGAVDYVIGNDPGKQITTDLYFVDTGYDLGLTDSYTSQEAKVNRTTYEQHLAELSLAGNVFDGWAGPVSLAVGGSYRKESFFQISRDSSNPSANYDSYVAVMCSNPALGLRGVSAADCTTNAGVGTQYSKVWNIQADTDVWEAFAETLVPLLDTGGVTANLNAAVRWADYSNSGEIWAYKGGLDVAIGDSIRLRGTYSRDVRAPNLNERYDKTGGSATLTDPRYPGDGTINVTIFSGGNQFAKPEKADNFTAGAVLRPAFLPGLSLSVDWWRVEIKGALGRVGVQTVADRCEAGGAEYCLLITRDPVTDRISLIGDVVVNVAEAVASGIDAELSYTTDATILGGDESISTRVFANWLTERSEVDSTGIYTDRKGQVGASPATNVYYGYPDFRVTGNVTYRNGPFSAFFQGRYVGPGVQDACVYEDCLASQVVKIADNSVDSVFYADLRLGYEFGVGNTTVELWGSVTNLFDTDPPVTPTYAPFSGYSTQVNAGVYDVLGRRYTVGLKFRM
jgi:outer membrane receptor protein involved in Fe transport